MHKSHTDRAYEAELRGVRENLLRMAGHVEEMIADSAAALIEGDIVRARRVIAADEEVNSLEVETDEQCLLILAKRQPLASDLRMITLAMKMVTDLERIGDLAVNIAERAVALGSAPKPQSADVIVRMAEAAQAMIRDAIDAFITRDTEQAKAIFGRDEEVDDLYFQLTSDVGALMLQDPSFVERGVHLNAIAKFLERIADHGTNLAELVIFLVEGKDIRHKPMSYRSR